MKQGVGCEGGEGVCVSVSGGGAITDPFEGSTLTLVVKLSKGEENCSFERKMTLFHL